MTERIESVRAASFRGPNVGSGGPGDGDTPIAELLQRYAVSTALAPRGDLTARIASAIVAAPEPTPPRRYLWALLAFDLRGATRSFRAMLEALTAPGRARTVVRAQSLALVMATLLATGALAAAGSTGVLELLRRAAPEPNLPVVPQPSLLNGLPAPMPTIGATPSTRLPADAPGRSVDPAATDSSVTETTDPNATDAPPTDGSLGPPSSIDPHVPGPTPDAPQATPGIGDPSPGPTTRPTAGPTTAPGATDPPQPTPRPTPRPTEVPPTAEPEKTDPPETQRPKETEPASTDEPNETDPPRTHEPDQTEAPDNGGDGGGSDATPTPGGGSGGGSDTGLGDGALDLLGILARWLVW